LQTWALASGTAPSPGTSCLCTMPVSWKILRPVPRPISSARSRRWMMHPSYLVALSACLLSTQVVSAQKRAPTVTESLGWARALGPQLSPDGRSLAYEVQETDWSGDAFVNAIWIAEAIDGHGPPRRIVNRGSSPRWSPDGQRLAFLADH